MFDQARDSPEGDNNPNEFHITLLGKRRKKEKIQPESIFCVSMTNTAFALERKRRIRRGRLREMNLFSLISTLVIAVSGLIGPFAANLNNFTVAATTAEKESSQSSFDENDSIGVNRQNKNEGQMILQQQQRNPHTEHIEDIVDEILEKRRRGGAGCAADNGKDQELQLKLESKINKIRNDLKEEMKRSLKQKTVIGQLFDEVAYLKQDLFRDLDNGARIGKGTDATELSGSGTNRKKGRIVSQLNHHKESDDEGGSDNLDRTSRNKSRRSDRNLQFIGFNQIGFNQNYRQRLNVLERKIEINKNAINDSKSRIKYLCSRNSDLRCKPRKKQNCIKRGRVCTRRNDCCKNLGNAHLLDTDFHSFF